MTLECASCGQIIEIPDGLPDGQHVRCPYCEVKLELVCKTGEQPLFKAITEKDSTAQVPSNIHVRQISRVSLPSRTAIHLSRETSCKNEPKKGGAGEWLLYGLLAVVLTGLGVYWLRMQKSSVDEQLDVGLQSEPNAKEEVDVGVTRHDQEAAERERRRAEQRAKEEAELAKCHAERARREAEREKVRREMSQKVERERLSREAIANAEILFNGVNSVFASDFAPGSRPFDFGEDGVVTVADADYIASHAFYRLTVVGKRLKSVQRISPGKDLEDVAPEEFMRKATNRVVLARQASGPVWICGETKMNELIDLPESADAYVPLADFMGGSLPVLRALQVIQPLVKYRITLQAKTGKGTLKLGIVENEIDLQAIRAKIRGQLTDRRLQRMGIGLKPPRMKKFKRTVVFYDGEIMKKDIGGLTKIPRHYVFRVSAQNRTTAEEQWKKLAKIAEEEERRDLEVEEENQRRMDEYRRKADEALRNSRPTEAEVDSELSRYRMLIERSRTKLPKE